MRNAMCTLVSLLSVASLASCAEEPDMLETASGPAALVAPATSSCSALEEIIAPSVLAATERGAFTTQGRLFIIGARPANTPEAGSWLFEITKEGAGYAADNVVAGTLEGTEDGMIGGAPRGDVCTFSGMAVDGDLLYAGCYAADGRASLFQIDTALDRVRAGYFTTCNSEPAGGDCAPVSIYPNGMTVDDEGRVYASDMNAHGVSGTAGSPYSLYQIFVGAEQPPTRELRFEYRGWLAKDLAFDGPAPNGIQYAEGKIHFVGGANIHAIPVRPDGSAGRPRTIYRGPLLSYIDDFALGDGEILVGRTLPAAVVALSWRNNGRAAREAQTCSLPPLAPPSSLTFQPDLLPEQALFPSGTVVVTSFFGGGLYTMRAALTASPR